ncbi:Transcription initiation factor TFIID subunit 10 [Mortierella alpina]|nr:Transcription initiation factor TFIID subunit 10 [Mortierella alpina]
MSDGSNSSHSTVEDATMASPQPSLHSGTSTPVQIRSEADNLTTATPMDQDTPSSNQTPTQAPTSTIASPAGANSEQQQQAASPSSSAPMTPSYASTPITAASLASTSMIGVVSTSTPPASFSTSDVGASSAASTTTPLPSKGSEMPGVQTQSSTSSVQPLSQQQQQQQQQHHLQLLQKQAQEQAHLAQLQQAQATATASVAQHNLAVGAALQSRKEEELNRKDRTLAEFLPMMESYNPIIPDAVTDYYLSRTGFDCDDVRIKRLLALAAQKFVSDIATDAFQYCKVRQQSQKRTPGKEKKTVLTMEDLSDALGEYGINVKKPDYFM